MPGVLGDTSDVAGDELEVALLGEVESSGYRASYRNWIFSCFKKDNDDCESSFYNQRKIL